MRALVVDGQKRENYKPGKSHKDTNDDDDDDYY